MGNEEDCGWEMMVESEFENIERTLEMDHLYTTLAYMQGSLFWAF
jgi:hypothetical protein